MPEAPAYIRWATWPLYWDPSLPLPVLQRIPAAGTSVTSCTAQAVTADSHMACQALQNHDGAYAPTPIARVMASKPESAATAKSTLNCRCLLFL